MATRKSYTLEYKIEVITYAKKHGNRAAERKFNIDESMARLWRKKEDLFRASDKSRRSFRGSPGRYPILEEKVAEWTLSQKALRGTITGKEVKEKAVQISKELGIEDFRGTTNWYYRFLRRQKINTDRLNWNTKVLKWKPRNVNKKEPTTPNSKIANTTPSSRDYTLPRITSIQSCRPKNVSTQTRIAVTPTNSSKQQQSSLNGSALNNQLESLGYSASSLFLSGSNGTSIRSGTENIETIFPLQSHTNSDHANVDTVSVPQQTSLSAELENNSNISDISIFSSPDRLFFSSICMDMERLPFKEKLRFKQSVLRLLHERLLKCEES
ncbi:uncharacterized protein LOC120338865 [Styela clava]